MDESLEQKLVGNLEFFSETGTEGGHWAFYELGKEGYDGLYILKNSDYVTIYDGENNIAWSGLVDLKPRESFNEHVFGYRVHSTPKNIDKNIWGQYFFHEYKAELIKHEE